MKFFKAGFNLLFFGFFLLPKLIESLGRRINYSKKKTPGGKHVSRGKANVLDEANLKAICKPNENLKGAYEVRKPIETYVPFASK